MICFRNVVNRMLSLGMPLRHSVGRGLKGELASTIRVSPTTASSTSSYINPSVREAQEVYVNTCKHRNILVRKLIIRGNG